MPTDNHSPKSDEHPMDGSPAERTHYLMMLGRWARGDSSEPESGSSGNGSASNAGK